MSSVRHNIVANYLGGAWSALMGFAFVPIYIRYVGMEAYGLIGIFTLLQAWLTVLDFGLTPTLSREMARFRAGAHTPQTIRDLMRSIELLCMAIAACVAIGVFLAAHWIATDWVRAEKLSTTTVAHALAVTGFIIGSRWLAALYRSALSGLQRQVWLNICGASFSTLRGLGAIAVLAWVSPTIMTFFVYQVLLVAVEALVMATKLRRLLPTPPQPARFQWGALRQISRFAGGMATITILSILLTQVDKLMLSKLLPLTNFAYYTLGSTMAGALSLLIAPINNAIYPRIIEFVSLGEINTLADAYHKFSQMLTLIVAPAGIVMSLFSTHILLLWTRDVNTTVHVAPLVSILAIGTMLNGLMHTPYTLQLAYGWTRFMVVVNIVSVLIIVPLIYIEVQIYGAIAAAFLWVFLNASYLLIAVPMMHRKLLPSELRHWFITDTLAPASAGLLAAGFVRLLSSNPTLNKPLENIFELSLAAAAATSAAALATPIGRDLLRQYIRPIFVKTISL